MNKKLYKNTTTRWGDETKVMTYDEWLKGMLPLFEIWFKEAQNNNEELLDRDFEDWLCEIMNDELEEI